MVISAILSRNHTAVNRTRPPYDHQIDQQPRCQRTVTFPSPVSPELTLAPLRRGRGDPCFTVLSDGTIWRTSRPASGPVAARIRRCAPNAVQAVAWGAGAEEFLADLPALLGADDGDAAAGFVPREPTVAAALRAVPQLRLGRTGRVLEALIPAVIEQRVPGADAFASWRILVTGYGTPPPGPTPPGMRVPPTAEVWRSIPSWEFHRANVDPGRARTIVGCAQRASALERLTVRPAAQARQALTSLPGVGEWTAAETAQRAFGDPDAVSVGDYHLPTMVGYALAGHPVDDQGMLELLEPLRPHRYRAIRLLQASGLATRPRRGPRLPVRDLREL